MADAEIEKTTIKIALDGTDYDFTANGEVVTFDGFLRLYHESFEEEEQPDDETRQLPNLTVG